MLAATYALLALPIALFLATWVTPMLGLLGVVVLIGSFVKVWRLSQLPAASLTRNAIAVAFGVSIFWLSVSGAGGIGWQQNDWLKHNIVLADLVRNPWPVLYSEERTLVYYLAYYLTPAMFGKLGGWHLAYFVLGLETWAFYFLSALWVVRLLGGRSWLGLLLFCAFSGLDVIGNLYVSSTWGYDPWWSRLQYSSPALLVMFVPQHVIIGWLGTALVIESARLRRPELAVYTGALSLCWSPFVTLGLAPFILWTWLRHQGWQHALALQVSMLLTVFVPVALFFQARAHLEVLSWLGMGISHPTFIAFMLLEWGVFAIALLCLDGRQLLRRPFVLLAILSLLVIPFVPFAGYTDYVMRASIPSLFLLALQAIESATVFKRFSIALAALWIALFVGSLQAFGLYRQSIAHLEFNIPPMELVPTLPGMSAHTGHPGDGKQYFGRRDTLYFRYLAARSDRSD